jgi:predicted ATPase
MLTRLRVSGFKNLVDVDVAFGPFTCIAGPNASGKSNLFDAIAFLSFLADRPLIDAASAIRGESGKATEVRNLFHRVGSHFADRMEFEAEMIIPDSGTDDLGQIAKATTTFLRYKLVLAYREANDPDALSELEITEETLDRILIGDAPKHLRFEHSPSWRKTAVRGQRGKAFISTEAEGGRTVVKIHQDQRGGRTRILLANRLPRTALSSSTAAENPTALLARREMQSWRELQLEPSALREPDSFRAPAALGTDGRHLAATVSYLAEMHEREYIGGEKDFLAQLANRLSTLIEDVRTVSIDRDEKRELVTLSVDDRLDTRHPARALSDGTLRFLALSVIEADPRFGGVLCLEEPENGIHPDRIKPMLSLLHEIAVDTQEPVGLDNPLRQVIVNTHSPGVVGQIKDNELLVSVPIISRNGVGQYTRAGFRWLSDTWRSRAWPDVPTISRGALLAYLNPYLEEREVGERGYGAEPSDRPRVIDREDMRQLRLPLAV